MEKITEVIKYEGDNKTFVWKYPHEDFNNQTQLIVHESQEAILFLDGQALDVFSAGRHTLKTENIPNLWQKFFHKANEFSTFHCEVYFINKAVQMAIKWGVPDIEYFEPTYEFPLKIGASGELTLRVDNGKKLLLKLVGTENDLSQEKLTSLFRGVITTKIKSLLVKTIKQDKINIFEIDGKLDELSEKLLPLLKPEFENYGVLLEKVLINNIVKPINDAKYQKFEDLHFRKYADITDAKIRQEVSIIDEQTKAQRMLIESQALATKRAQEGYNYQQEKGFEVASELARNSNSGQFASLGVGLGTMTNVAGTVGGMLNQSLKNLNGTPSQINCTKCGTPLPQGAKFCHICGSEINSHIETKKICKECGADLPNNSKFCLQCGTKVE